MQGSQKFRDISDIIEYNFLAISMEEGICLIFSQFFRHSTVISWTNFITKLSKKNHKAFVLVPAYQVIIYIDTETNT